MTLSSLLTEIFVSYKKLQTLGIYIMFCSQIDTDLVRIPWTIFAPFYQIRSNTLLPYIILCSLHVFIVYRMVGLILAKVSFVEQYF